MSSTVRGILIDIFREVVPLAKDYYMAEMDGRIAARNIEIAKVKAAESLTAIQSMQIPQRPPTGTLEQKISQQLELLDPKKAVGRQIWSLFHTRAGYYPDQPTPEEQEAMRTFIISTIAAFPCTTCASWGLGYIEQHPIDLSSRAGLKQYLCDFHNAKNVELGKPVHDCSTV